MIGRVDLVQGRRRLVLGPPDAELRASVTINSPRRFWRSLAGGLSIGLAESYAEGHWDSDDLVALVRIFAPEMARLDRPRALIAPLVRASSRAPQNTREASRRHIAAHYDLGNELFSLFLDESMTYSAAVFDPPHIDLHAAQREKLDRACRKLQLNEDDHLLEIGTGWGSMALHAAGRYGCRVTTTTLSREQHAYATQRVRENGLDDRVEVLLDDYRELRGSYSKLVSVEMIEAVGWQYLDEYFRVCSRLLEDDGAMLLQAIVFADDLAFEAEKSACSFANTLVFPGGCLPSVEAIGRSLAAATDMRQLGLEDITADYARTLRAWRSRFRARAADAEALGYDERFRRLWDFYLAWSEGGFAQRRILDVQMLLAKPGYPASRLNIPAEMRSSRNAGPRAASFASASRPPGPSTL